jgi:NADP-dependent 3-hydroxy acid dehydrogenase YdfG
MRAPYRVVVITGASSGLGAALAAAYAGPETALGIVGRNPERLAATASVCRAAGASVDSALIDVADGPALAAWLGEFDRAHPVELLVANAGTSAGPDRDSPGEPESITLRQIEVNLVGAVHTIAPLVPLMRARARRIARSPRSPPFAACPTARATARARRACAPMARRCGPGSRPMGSG